MILSKSCKPILLAMFPLSFLFFFAGFMVTSYLSLWGDGYEWGGWSFGTSLAGLVLFGSITANMLGDNQLGETVAKLFTWVGFLSFMFLWTSFMLTSYLAIWGGGYEWTMSRLWALCFGLLMSGFMAWGKDEPDGISDILNSTMAHALKWFFVVCILFFLSSLILANYLSLWGGYEWGPIEAGIIILGMVVAYVTLLRIRDSFFNTHEPATSGKTGL